MASVHGVAESGMTELLSLSLCVGSLENLSETERNSRLLEVCLLCLGNKYKQDWCEKSLRMS